MYVLDRHQQPLPIGVPGELYIGGSGLARGYLNRPELTKEKFVPDPFRPQTRKWLYKTGDLARRFTDGTIEILGRLDNQVKIRGFRIELGEIESGIRQHPAVRDTAVVVYENTPGDKRLVAYVVKEPESSAGSDELRKFLKRKLPDYMLPAAFMFVDALPRTPNGKLDRNALPRPDQSGFDVKTYQAPRTAAEETVAKIWADVLKVERVGIHDNFFDLGGHSLLATRVISRTRAAFHTDLSLRSFFEAPTVAEMVTLIMKDQAQQLDEECLRGVLTELELEEA
jgi:non-ribosomal peptide synthetase component F